MRNDEKIDIQLQSETSDENLTAEELAQQNYDTALRYINIAEHMKQYEDQDKYYPPGHQVSAPCPSLYKSPPPAPGAPQKEICGPARRERSLFMRRPCQIRDRARTPNDYYSAQTVFDRIHHHELRHKIPERRITPELYERLLKCADSEQQSIACGEMAEKKAAEMKRHSLFVSIIFIAVIAAILAFSRTTAFYRFAGAALSLIGDHDTAWRCYRIVYDRSEMPMHTQIIRNRDIRPLLPPQTVRTRRL